MTCYLIQPFDRNTSPNPNPMKQKLNLKLTQELTPQERLRLAFRNLQAAAQQAKGVEPLPVVQPKDRLPGMN